jgi:hypothetical protein
LSLQDASGKQRLKETLLTEGCNEDLGVANRRRRRNKGRGLGYPFSLKAISQTRRRGRERGSE